MLARVQELLASEESFALETTLATRIYLPILAAAQAQGYFVRMLFLWLNSPEAAIERAKRRVQEGGHNIPEEVVRRRYEGGLRQFFEHYRTAVNSWVFVNNSNGSGQIVAEGSGSTVSVQNADIWQQLTATYHV